MPIMVHWNEDPKLKQKLLVLSTKLDPAGPEIAKLRADIEQVAIDDNIDKLLGHGSLAGIDRLGNPLAPPAPSTLADPKRGPGPVLVPKGMASRFITNFKVRWYFDGAAWRMIAGWVDVLSKSGVHFVIFHLTGSSRLPKRDVGGLSPDGQSQVKALFAKFVKGLK